MSEKGSRHRPWFPFYAADFAGTVRTWSTQEIGAYILLLGEQWINGSVPTDEKQLARIHPDIVACWKTKLQSKFPDGRNARLEEIRVETIEKTTAASEAGRTAAHARWGTQAPDDDADAMPSHMRTHNESQSERITKGDANAMLSTPTPIPRSKTRSRTKIKSSVSDSMWDKFCALYPKRNGPDPNKSARAKAERAVKNGAAWSDIMTGLRKYSDHCKTIESQFIMRKETFLNVEKEFWNSDYAEADEQSGAGVDDKPTAEAQLLGMADILGIKHQEYESDDGYLDRLRVANIKRIEALGSRT